MQRLPTHRMLGATRAARSTGGLQLAEMQPTVPAHEVHTHTHEEAHFVLVTDGDYVTSAGGRTASAGHVLVANPPGTTHRDHFLEPLGRFFAFSMPAERWRSAAAELSLPTSPAQLGPGAQVAALRLGMELRQWVDERDDVSTLGAEACMAELLGSAAAEAEAEGRQLAVRAQGPAWLAVACARLDDEPASAPSFEVLAKDAGVHPVHFARAFRRRLGCSPGDYLRRRRLDLAVQLLQQRQLALVEVALRAGYCDQAHLTHAFRRRYGITPGAYRAAT